MKFDSGIFVKMMANGSSVLRFARHATYVNFPRPDDCAYLHKLDVTEQCAFVESAEACAESRFYFNYIRFLYCTIGSDHYFLFALGFIFLMLVCVYYFVILGTTADQFFCPTLATIAKSLNISESLAGVTILAFGNGSPDLFTAVANPDADTELMFSELFGSAAFVIGVIGGTVLLIQPFDFAPLAISRDLAFFIGSVLWITYKANDERFTLLDSGVLIGIYVVFLVLVVWEFIVAKRELHGSFRNIREKAEIIIRCRDPPPAAGVREELPRPVAAEQDILPNEGLWSDAWKHLNPIDMNDWWEAGWFMRSFAIAKVPFVLILLLTIPIVDVTVERDGWCKLLNAFHCLSLPLLMVWINGFALVTVVKVPLLCWVAAPSLTLMAIVFCTSRTDRCPKYHKLFTLLSFLGCIQIIYIVAQEVVSLLETLGIVLQLSKSVLGLSLLAWGNSVGDLFSNVTLARQGYGKMAFAACFGGPLLNLCLGLGLTLIAKALRDPNLVAQVRKGVMGENCEAYLFQILATTWLGLLFTRFEGRRSIGLSMIVTYAVFLIFSFLGEFELIHPYGTDHHPDPFAEGSNAAGR
ncbi:putative sodium/calcium exchanger 7 [Anopheles bellator]|uniref:putative sodium/calcium exchanger 7 n=1 Tax=Anopheles bellator TaxID=139047 RepID=UPI0026482EB0|nr:putative sodium/calcium exchanger 7 [Anopheles bellator]